MLRLLEDCLYALAHLQENNMIHADLRPELIGVPVKNERNFRLLDRLGDPSPPNQVQLNNIKSKRELYTSPALFRALSQRRRKVRHNPFKSDVFGLGMILLEAGLLESVQSVYDKKSGEIDENAMVDLVQKLFLRYSQNYILQEMLLIMLEFDERPRQEPKKLLRSLRQLKEMKFDTSGSFNVNFLVNSGDAGEETLRQFKITENGYQLRESHLANISYLKGGSEVPARVSAQTDLKSSLVEMLKNRTSFGGKTEYFSTDLAGSLGGRILASGVSSQSPSYAQDSIRVSTQSGVRDMVLPLPSSSKTSYYTDSNANIDTRTIKFFKIENFKQTNIH